MGTRNPNFGFWKCHGEMGLRQVEGKLFPSFYAKFCHIRWFFTVDHAPKVLWNFRKIKGHFLIFNKMFGIYLFWRIKPTQFEFLLGRHCSLGANVILWEKKLSLTFFCSKSRNHFLPYCISNLTSFYFAHCEVSGNST